MLVLLFLACGPSAIDLGGGERRPVRPADTAADTAETAGDTAADTADTAADTADVTPYAECPSAGAAGLYDLPGRAEVPAELSTAGCVSELSIVCDSPHVRAEYSATRVELGETIVLSLAAPELEPGSVAGCTLGGSYAIAGEPGTSYGWTATLVVAAPAPEGR